jgi:glycosyltransferase involved in cell wall biosynthesis
MNPRLDLGLSDEPGKEHSLRVSVVLAAYNAENYICDAIESILGQNYEGFELIVVDDGSSDRTSELLDGFGDQRIVRLRNEKNLGVAAARNRGGAIAKGEFIAVHDADDLSMPERFEKQVAYLDENPDVGVVGSQGWLLTPGGRTEINVPQSNDEIQARLIGQNCMHHSSLMIRASAMKLVGGYDESYSAALDLDLVLRLAEITRMANLQDRLYVKQPIAGSISISDRALQQKRNSMRAIEDALRRRRKRGWSVIPHQRYALNCLITACAEAAFGDEYHIEACLVRALEVDNNVVSKEEAAKVVANFAVTYAKSAGAAGGDPFQIVSRVFEQWPEGQRSTPLERRIRALVSSSLAFSYYRKGKWRQVIHPALNGLMEWPSYRGNRGLLSICVRATTHALSDFLRI